MAETRAPDHPEIREAVARLCAGFPGEYWRALDRDMRYPTEFVQALTEAGYLAVLIPEEYGGSGMVRRTRSGTISRRSRPASCVCRPSASPSRRLAPTRRRSAPRHGGRA